MVWSMVERLSVQGIQFILGIILARILSPTEYGTIGLLMVIIAFMQVFVDSGFSKALIHKQDRTQIDLSTVFFFNILISIISYMTLWFNAPFIADFYQNEMLTNLMRVLALSLLFGSLFTIPMTLFTIELDFKSIARTNLIAVVLSGAVSIIMAYKGYGVWALVYQTVIKSFLTVVLMWSQMKWKPIFVFSKTSFKSLFPYGSKFLLSSILNISVNNFSNLFIAKLTSAKDLGFYTRGTQFADLVYGTFSSVLDSVLLPSLASIQEERDKLIRLTRLAIKSTALVVIPVLLGLAIVAEPLIKLLLTDKWLMAVPIMQILCIARLITIISGINVNVLYAIGRTDLALKQQYVKLIVRVLLLIFALKYGIIYVALAELFSTIIHFFINTYYPGKILNYGSFQQIKDLLPIFISSILMALGMYISMFFIENNFIKLIIALILSFPIYFGFVYLFKVEELFLISTKIKGFFLSKNN
jgi:teichuronic acid exporter